jgi:hypothetical protein
MKFENVHEVAMNVDICRRFIDFQERGCIERPCLFPSLTIVIIRTCLFQFKRVLTK